MGYLKSIRPNSRTLAIAAVKFKPHKHSQPEKKRFLKLKVLKAICSRLTLFLYPTIKQIRKCP